MTAPSNSSLDGAEAFVHAPDQSDQRIGEGVDLIGDVAQVPVDRLADRALHLTHTGFHAQGGIDIDHRQSIGPIEQELLPLYEFMQYPDQIEFEDQILKVVVTFIKASKQISPAMERMLPVYPQYFKKHQMMMFQLLPTLNQYCLYGKTFF